MSWFSFWILFHGSSMLNWFWLILFIGTGFSSALANVDGRVRVDFLVACACIFCGWNCGGVFLISIPLGEGAKFSDVVDDQSSLDYVVLFWASSLVLPLCFLGVCPPDRFLVCSSVPLTPKTSFFATPFGTIFWAALSFHLLEHWVVGRVRLFLIQKTQASTCTSCRFTNNKVAYSWWSARSADECFWYKGGSTVS